ncbi:MAG TPA: 23S rRNA (guanosine(2251)-2'-O)-methyltransferase RlmB [Spirochaetia bacterium]|nr:23S rRNA (guanosine(2251)-2'-O)-methyltransferase RlmB [Spirochaetia bacterium]
MQSILTGFHAISERLASGSVTGTLHVSRTGSRVDELVELAKKRGIEVRTATDSRLRRLSGRDDHRGAVLECSETALVEETFEQCLKRLADHPQTLVLAIDGVTDPHNLGAILRSADQFAVDVVVLPARRSAQDNETVARTSAGADAYVPLVSVPNLVRALDTLKEGGYWIFGADSSGTTAAKVDMRGRSVLVVGSEGQGLGRLVREHCDALVAIPTKGHIDSFNVSVAAGILLYEARRQQWM